MRKKIDTATAVGLVATAAITLAVILLMVTGFYSVRPGEATAIQTFGAARAEPEAQEGLHWHWPWPIGTTTTVQVEKSRTAEIGYQSLPRGRIDLMTGENWQRDLSAATMITGDLNLLEIQMVAQYYISDLNAYLFEADDPGIRFEYIRENGQADTHRSHPESLPDGQSIKDAMEIAIRRSIGHRTIDRALVTDRETIEMETMEQAQEILNTYRTGLTITAVQLQEIKPPDEVQEAFDDVLKAREEKDKRINEALAFESRTLPEARGEAERIRQEAERIRQEAERIRQEAERIRQEAERIRQEAERIRQEAERIRQEAERIRQEAERIRQEAERIRQEAERIRQEAERIRQERINAAEGEAGRFESILEEYQASPEIIARRMYLETMDKVLPRTRQVLITGQQAGPIILNTGDGTVMPIPQGGN